MKKLNQIKCRLESGKPIRVLNYVRMERHSEERKKQIIANGGTETCREFLKKHPNIRMAEKPYVDCNYSTRNIGDRIEWSNMSSRFTWKDIDAVIVDDIFELTSSFADAITMQDNFDVDGMIVYDIRHGIFYDSADKQIEKRYSELMLLGRLGITNPQIPRLDYD